MATSRTRNFHVPLSEGMYKQLRDMAQKTNLPATVLAREAIESWLKQKKKQERSQQLAQYAAQTAGTIEDLDRELEQASLEIFFSDNSHADT